MGLQRDRDSRAAAAAGADGAISPGGRGDAISGEEISAGAEHRATSALHGDWLFGGEVRAKNYRVHGEPWTPDSGGDHPAGDCRGGNGLLLLEREQEEETEIEMGIGKCRVAGAAGTFAQSCTNFLRVAERNLLPSFRTAPTMHTD